MEASDIKKELVMTEGFRKEVYNGVWRSSRCRCYEWRPQ